MSASAPWIARAGALLIALSPFVPQCADPQGSFSPVTLFYSYLLPERVSFLDGFAIGTWMLLPALVGPALLVSGARPRGGGAVLRGLVVALLFAACFSLATLGSLMLVPNPTPIAATGNLEPLYAAGTPGFALSIALFALPLALGTIGFARIMGGGFSKTTGAYERAALALLVVLDGFFLMDLGWKIPLAWASRTPHALPGAWLVPVAGGIAFVGELLRQIPPRAAVDISARSG